MTYSARARPLTLGLPDTEWCPGGEWAIFMALNWRKDFPRVTRQNSSCLEPERERKRERWRTLKKKHLQLLYAWVSLPETSPLTHITWPVLVKWTSGASSYTIHVLVALRGVLGEVDPGPEHASDVGVSLVKAFVDDGVYKWRTCVIRLKKKI